VESARVSLKQLNEERDRKEKVGIGDCRISLGRRIYDPSRIELLIIVARRMIIYCLADLMNFFYLGPNEYRYLFFKRLLLARVPARGKHTDGGQRSVG
jgi:hypothetical protein